LTEVVVWIGADIAWAVPSAIPAATPVTAAADKVVLNNNCFNFMLPLSRRRSGGSEESTSNNAGSSSWDQLNFQKIS
jgi:hypothetical protein